MNYFSLDRIEDNCVAVLVDDNGKIIDIPLNELQDNPVPGNIYSCVNGNYTYDEKETTTRKLRMKEKRKRLFDRAVNTDHKG